MRKHGVTKCSTRSSGRGPSGVVGVRGVGWAGSALVVVWSSFPLLWNGPMEAWLLGFKVTEHRENHTA